MANIQSLFHHFGRHFENNCFEIEDPQTFATNLSGAISAQ